MMLLFMLYCRDRGSEASRDINPTDIPIKMSLAATLCLSALDYMDTCLSLTLVTSFLIMYLYLVTTA